MEPLRTVASLTPSQAHARANGQSSLRYGGYSVCVATRCAARRLFADITGASSQNRNNPNAIAARKNIFCFSELTIFRILRSNNLHTGLPLILL